MEYQQVYCKTKKLMWFLGFIQHFSPGSFEWNGIKDVRWGFRWYRSLGEGRCMNSDGRWGYEKMSDCKYNFTLLITKSRVMV